MNPLTGGSKRNHLQWHLGRLWEGVQRGYCSVDRVAGHGRSKYTTGTLLGSSRDRLWRKGRVLLAGDAVHQTPPFLGQGLGSGIRDAANLAWKLVHIRRCGLNAALFDSYRDERRSHVVTVVEAAKEFGKIVGELDMDKPGPRRDAGGGPEGRPDGDKAPEIRA